MTDQPEPEETCRPVEIDGETLRVRGAAELTDEGREALAALVRVAKAKFVEEAPEQVGVLQNRLRLAHKARRAKEHQLDDIRRALCDIGFMQDDDPYSHADLADVIRQNGQPATEATERAKSPLREQIAAAIYEKSNPGFRWADAHPDDVLAYGTDADAALKVIEEHLDIGEAEAWCKTCRRVWDGPRHQCESDAEQRLARVVSALPPYSLPTHGDRSEGVQMGWDLARQAALDALNPPTTTAPGRTSEAAVEREITP